jgi:hypothetical protein
VFVQYNFIKPNSSYFTLGFSMKWLREIKGIVFVVVGVVALASSAVLCGSGACDYFGWSKYTPEGRDAGGVLLLAIIGTLLVGFGLIDLWHRRRPKSVRSSNTSVP